MHDSGDAITGPLVSNLLTDAQYLYFADVGMVDTSPAVDTSAGDGIVYRVAK